MRIAFGIVLLFASWGLAEDTADPWAAHRKLKVLSDEVAEKTARELEDYPGQAERHLDELKAILDDEGSNYAS